MGSVLRGSPSGAQCPWDWRQKARSSQCEKQTKRLDKSVEEKTGWLQTVFGMSDGVMQRAR